MATLSILRTNPRSLTKCGRDPRGVAAARDRQSSYCFVTLAMLSGRPVCGPWVVASVTDMPETFPETPEPPLLPPHPTTAAISINAPATSIHRRELSFDTSAAKLTIIVRISHGTGVECSAGLVFCISAA